MSALGGEWSNLLQDLEKGFELLRRLPPAVTFFGGARIREDDPFYQRSEEIGRMLAERGIPPRTGAGPGIMTSVPEGYKSAPPNDVRCKTGAFSKAMVQAYTAGPTTRRLGRPGAQGIKIFLPFEPDVVEAIDHQVELVTFPIRRLMLYENSVALVVFPGGIGTLDELFEVWARRSAGLHNDPIVLFGVDFYGPIMDALTGVMQSRGLLEPRELESVLVTDDPQALLDMVSAVDLTGFDEVPADLARRLAQEIPYVAGVLSMAAPALACLGGDGLPASDPALAVAEQTLSRLAGSQTALRVGSTGPLAELARRTYGADGKHLLQGFFLRREGEAQVEWESARIEVTDLLAHKLLLTQNARGFLALPGPMQTLDEVFSILCEMQTGKRSKAPFVLVGTDFWRPIVEACEKVMLSSERQTISPEDFHMLRIVDTAEEALSALSEGA